MVEPLYLEPLDPDLIERFETKRWVRAGDDYERVAFIRRRLVTLQDPETAVHKAAFEGEPGDLGPDFPVLVVAQPSTRGQNPSARRGDPNELQLMVRFYALVAGDDEEPDGQKLAERLILKAYSAFVAAIAADRMFKSKIQDWTIGYSMGSVTDRFNRAVTVQGNILWRLEAPLTMRL